MVLLKKNNSSIDKKIDEIAGMWNDHPLFKSKSTKEIIELMRGTDDEKNPYKA